MKFKKKEYDYYKTIKEKTEFIIDKYLYIPIMEYDGLEINFKQNFYIFFLKLIDKEVYGLDFKFSKGEISFYTTFKVDTILKEAIALCQPDIRYYRKQIKKLRTP